MSPSYWVLKVSINKYVLNRDLKRPRLEISLISMGSLFQSLRPATERLGHPSVCVLTGTPPAEVGLTSSELYPAPERFKAQSNRWRRGRLKVQSQSYKRREAEFTTPSFLTV